MDFFMNFLVNKKVFKAKIVKTSYRILLQFNLNIDKIDCF